jgi:dTDP-4-dehydrorhamnose reductase
MRVIVLGASGMLGFALHRVLHDRRYDVVGTVRGAPPASPWCAGLRYTAGVHAGDIDSVRKAVRGHRADVVINAAGVIKQITDATGEQLNAINAVFPRRLALWSRREGFNVVHFSTDCVFAGTRGAYVETDVPDATDVYGVSKFLGEDYGSGQLVLRTSIIGRGLQPNPSLVDWLLSQSGSVRGYAQAIFSGLPVNNIASIVADLLLTHAPPLEGLYHLSAAPIAKLELVQLLRDAWERHDLQIIPDDSVRIDRSLDSSSLRRCLDWLPEDWPMLVAEMRDFYRKLDS